MNAAAHYWTAALAAGMVLRADERTRGQMTPWPIAGTGLAAVATDLPDILEPAVLSTISSRCLQSKYCFIWSG
jgi:hypothetical protein